MDVLFAYRIKLRARFLSEVCYCSLLSCKKQFEGSFFCLKPLHACNRVNLLKSIINIFVHPFGDDGVRVM